MRSAIVTLSLTLLVLVSLANGAESKKGDLPATIAPPGPPPEKDPGQKRDEPVPKKGDLPPAEMGAVEVHFADGNQFTLTLKEDTIEIVTADGKKTVRLADLRKVELAQRISDEDDKRIKAAVKALGSEAFKERQNATVELIRLGIKGYPALVAATKGNDAETKKRAEDIIETLKASLPEELFERSTEDILWTKDGKLVGKIGHASWKANTTQFGDVQVKLGDVVRLRAIGHPDPEEEKLAAQPDPRTMSGHARQVGKVFAFKVTGAPQGTGSVWGTGTYTSDSTIGVAAVHAGLLKVGQTKVIKVKVVAPLNAYTGSTKNGITTSGYGPWEGSYEFVK